MKHIHLNIRPNYQVVYDALQTCCVNIFRKHSINFDSGGAIGFYRCDDSIEQLQDRMQLRMFPISEKVACSFLPDEENIIRPILRAINEKKPYKYLDHLLHFRKYYSSSGHFEITFQNKDSIVDHDKEKGYVIIDGNQYYWSEIAKDLEINEQNSSFYKKYAKQLDHLIFKPGMDKVIVIPIPVLSTPSILFFFHYDDFENLTDNFREAFIIDLIEQASEAVSFYLYNRLIIEFTRYVKLEKIATEIELFDRYVRVISQILLPVSYTIDKGKSKNFFDWFGGVSDDTNNFSIDFFSYTDEENSFKEEFRHKVDFVIPDFKIPVMNPANQGRKNKYCFIRETNEYKVRQERIQFSLQNIYRLIYNNWKALQRERVFILENITPLIETLKSTDFDGLHRTLSEAKNEVGRLIKSVDNLQKGNYHSDYELVQEPNGAWVFRFARTEIYRGTEIGFETLHKIILNNGKKFDWETCKHFNDRLKDMTLNSYETSDTAIVSKNEMEEYLKSAERMMTNIRQTLNDSLAGKTEFMLSENRDFYMAVYGQKQNLDAYYSIAKKLNFHVEERYIKLNKQSIDLIKDCQKMNLLLWEAVKKDLKGTGKTVSGQKTIEQRAQETVCKSLVNILQKLTEHEILGEQIKKHFIDSNLIVEKNLALKKFSVATHNLRYTNPDPENVSWLL